MKSMNMSVYFIQCIYHLSSRVFFIFSLHPYAALYKLKILSCCSYELLQYGKTILRPNVSFYNSSIPYV